jgi:hypothetical protein
MHQHSLRPATTSQLKAPPQRLQSTFGEFCTSFIRLLYAAISANAAVKMRHRF